MAEHDRSSIAFGEPVQLIEEDGDLVDSGTVPVLGCGPVGLLLRGSEFHLAAPHGFGARTDGNPVGHPAQPARERVAGADRTRLAGQHQECGLERIVRIVRIGQQTAAGVLD